MRMKSIGAIIETQDMGLAIALLCLNYELIELEPPLSGSRITFLFKNKEDIDKSIQSYWNGKLLVDAKRYWNESKNLKTRLYSFK